MAHAASWAKASKVQDRLPHLRVPCYPVADCGITAQAVHKPVVHQASEDPVDLRLRQGQILAQRCAAERPTRLTGEDSEEGYLRSVVSHAADDPVTYPVHAAPPRC